MGIVALGVSAKIISKIRGRMRSLGNQQDLRQRLTSVAHLLAGNFTGSLIGLAAFALTARALGPADYGILALCFGYARAVERLVSFQSWQPLIKYGAAAREVNALGDLAQLMKFGFLLDLAAALLGFMVAVLIILLASPLFGVGAEGRSLALIYSLVLPFQLTGMPTATLRLFGRFAALAYAQVLSSIIRVVLCGLGLVLSWGLAEFTIVWMAMQIVGSISMVLLAFRELRRNGVGPILSAPLAGITERFDGLWRFAMSANISLTVRSSANELDTLLVGYLADPASAGLYHIAKRIGRIAQQGGAQIQAVVYPELATLWSQSKRTAFARAIRQTQVMLLSAGLAFVALIYILIEPLLLLLAGPAFVAAAPLVVVQAIAVMMTLNGSVLRSALLAMGLQAQVLRSVLLATAAFHLTAFGLIPRIGAMGANIAHIVMATIWFATMMLTYRMTLARAPAPASEDGSGAG